jgi:RecA/RadA recombinase
VRRYDPTSQRPSIVNGRRVQSKRDVWEVRISGIDNVERLSGALPTWGPRTSALAEALQDPDLSKHRGSQRGYLPENQTEPVLAYLHGLGVTAPFAAQLIGGGAGSPQGGLRQVLGHSRLRRDRVERLADALDSEFLREVLDEDVWYDKIVGVSAAEWRPTFDLGVDGLHSFVANDVVVHNCAPPFTQAEFDIMYGHGISREGSVLDIGVDVGLIKKSGAWYTYEGEQLGQGRENAKEFLRSNPEIMVEVSEKIRAAKGLGDHADLELEGDAAEAFTDADDAPISLDD